MTLLLPQVLRSQRIPMRSLFRPPLEPESILYAISAYSQAERDAMQHNCQGCGAMTNQPCITATGLTASQPCPARSRP